MGKTKLQITAMYMAMLIVMIPVYSATVFAELNDVRAKGTDSIYNYMRVNDNVTFEAKANITGDSAIGPTQLWLGSATAFAACSPAVVGIDVYDCSLANYPITGISTTLLFTVNLYNDTGTLEDSAVGNITVDNREPTITNIAIVPAATNTGEVNITYNAQDYAYDTGDYNSCSGISRVEFYKDSASGDLITTETLDTENCTVSGIVSYSTDINYGSETICAKAFDRFEQESAERCSSFSVDKVGPVILANSLLVYDSNGDVYYFSGDEITGVSISINITGDDLDKNNVVADLSELNPAAGYGRVQATCGSTADNLTVCAWSISLILNSSDTSYKLYINASDTASNKDSEIVSKSFSYDAEGPRATSISTDIIDLRGNYYIKESGNKFTASISESGSGIDSNDIFLKFGNVVINHLEELQQTYASFAADNCTGSYTCYWNDISLSVSDGLIQAFIDQDSKDIMGNAANYTSINVTLDKTAPSFFNITVKGLSGGTDDDYADFITTENSLEIELTVDEANPIDGAFGDFSKFITNTTKEEGTCVETNTTSRKTCSWTTSQIDKAGYIQDNLVFNVTDIVGNSLTYSYPLEVLELYNETADYWSSSVICSPSKIDRQITTLINQLVYCHVDLTANEADAETLTLELGSCEDMEQVNSSNQSSLNYIEQINLMNDLAGSTDPYVEVTLKATDMKIDSLDITCPISIKSKTSTKVTKYAEIENATISIPFYNMPLGEYSTEVQGIIDNAKDNILVDMGWITDLNKIMHYGEKLCELISTFIKIYGLFTSIGMILSIGETTSWEPFSSAAIYAARSRIQETQSGVGALTKTNWAWVSKFCKFFSCRLFYDEVWGKDSEESIGHALGEWQRGVLEVANTVSTGGGNFFGQDAYVTYKDGTETGYEEHLAGKLNPKDSIVISTLTLCIPGIIYNLNKLRQIECMYVDCLQTNAKNGLPIKVCEDQKHYSTCKYWSGELFQLLPWTGLWNAFIDTIKQALSSPWGFLDIFLGYACSGTIEIPKMGIPAQVCLINDLLGLIADVYEDLDGLGENWELEGDYCENID